MERVRENLGLKVLLAWSGLLLFRDAISSNSYPWLTSRVDPDFWGELGIGSLFFSANQVWVRSDSFLNPAFDFDIVPGLIDGGSLLFPQMLLLVVPLILVVLALRRTSRSLAISAAVSALLHPLYLVAAYLWFAHFRSVHHVIAWLPHESAFMRFLPGLFLASLLPVTGAVLVLRRPDRETSEAPEQVASLVD